MHVVDMGKGQRKGFALDSPGQLVAFARPTSAFRKEVVGKELVNGYLFFVHDLFYDL